MSYATGHNSLTSQYLLNIYIYCTFCRLCVINVWKKELLRYVRMNDCSVKIRFSARPIEPAAFYRLIKRIAGIPPRFRYTNVRGLLCCVVLCRQRKPLLWADLHSDSSQVSKYRINNFQVTAVSDQIHEGWSGFLTCACVLYEYRETYEVLVHRMTEDGGRWWKTVCSCLLARRRMWRLSKWRLNRCWTSECITLSNPYEEKSYWNLKRTYTINLLRKSCSKRHQFYS
jgi:hypothetical protein